MTMYKRGGFRRMNQMNGDFLAQLKEPLRSEVNRTVVGTNKATTTIMNKQLDLYFKEKNINVEKIRRSQEVVYGTMLRVHKEKKILQRAIHKNNQNDTRHRMSKIRKRNQIDEGKNILILNDAPPETETVTKTEESPQTDDGIGETERPAKKKKKKPTKDTGESGTDNTVAVDTKSTADTMQPRKSFEKRSRVLEVSKKAPLAPIVRERSNLTSETLAGTSDAAGTEKDHESIQPTKASDGKNILYLPPIVEKKLSREVSVSDIAIASVAEAQAKPNDQPNYRLETIGGGTQALSNPRRMSKNSLVMPTISEKDLLKDTHNHKCQSESDFQDTPHKISSYDESKTHVDPKVPEKKTDKRNTDDKSESQPNSSPDPATSTEISPEDEIHKEAPEEVENKKKMSLVKRNRKRAREKLHRQHKILQNEPFSVYVKNSKGCYVPTLTPFKRKEFSPPSEREQYFQKKMLKAQMEARIEQREKLESFFERMAEEEREKERIREAFKKAMAQEAEEARRKLLEEEQKLGFSSSQLATLYSKGIIPEGVDPNSFEAIKYCKYIRSFSPNSLEMAKRNTDMMTKDSSWK